MSKPDAESKTLKEKFVDISERMKKLAKDIQTGEIDRLEARQVINTAGKEIQSLKAMLDTKRLFG